MFAAPSLGRAFNASDAAIKRDRPLILGFDVWTRQFSADPGVIGRIVTIPGTPLNERWTVIGVMPRGFVFPAGANLWLAYDKRFYQALPIPTHVRLAPGATVEQVRSAMPGVDVTSLRESLEPHGARSIGLLLAAVAVLLLVAWVQVASLLCSKLLGRSDEIRTRIAVGASRMHIVRRFGVEGAVLVGASMCIAAIAAPVLLYTIVVTLPEEMTAGHVISLDVRAMIFAALLAAAGVMSLTVLPATVISRASAACDVSAGSRSTMGAAVSRWRYLLLASHVALTVLLLHMAALAWRGLHNASGADLGFRPDRLIAVRLPSEAIAAGATAGDVQQQLQRQHQMYLDTARAIAAVPGVGSVTYSNKWPLERVAAPLFPVTSLLSGTILSVSSRFIGRDYATTIGARIIEGRDIQEADVPRATALVNQTLARMLAQAGPVIGQHVAVNRNDSYRVVGVIADVAIDRPGENPRPELFLYTDFGAVILARLDPGGGVAGQSAVFDAVERLWGPRAPRRLASLEQESRRAIADYAARRTLLLSVSLMALPLALIGVLGAFNHEIGQRAREIAIRVTCGARRRDVARLFIQRLGLVVLAGTMSGVALGWVAGRIAANYLFGISAADGLATAGAVTGVAACASVAGVLALRRAHRLDPVMVLRQ